MKNKHEAASRRFLIIIPFLFFLNIIQAQSPGCIGFGIAPNGCNIDCALVKTICENDVLPEIKSCDDADGECTLPSDEKICWFVKKGLSGTFENVNGPNGGQFYQVVSADLNGSGDYYFKRCVQCSASCLQSNCSNEVTITINSLPVVNITNSLADMCVNDTRQLTATPAGGVFTIMGPGSINGLNILTATGSGDIPISYEYTNPSTGCKNSTTKTIKVNSLPVVTITNSLADMCINDTRQLTATPAGGVFTIMGPGSINGLNILTATGQGNIMISYGYTDMSTGCKNSMTKTIKVNSLPVVTITNSLADMCVNDTRQLTATPTGGTFTVTGPGSINGLNILTATDQGDIMISYEYTNLSTGCKNSTTKTIKVNSLPDVNITSSLLDMCVNDTRQLTATPIGGAFTIMGPGSINGTNVLTATSQGDITISYEYTNLSTGCKNSTTKKIKVYSLPIVSITNSIADMCINDIRQLTAIPNGGVFTAAGPGSINGSNVLSATGPGDITISYEYTNSATGCNSATSKIIKVNSLPAVNISNSLADMCVNDTRQLTATPTGGAFTVTGPGSINGSNLLTATGQGDITISYEYTNSSTGCKNATATTIKVNSLPVLNFTNSLADMCVNDTRQLSATPIGGSFTAIGPGSINGSNVLTVTSPGDITLSYEYTNTSTGCKSTTIKTIKVYSLPIVNITADGSTTFCQGNSVMLKSTQANSYKWSTGSTEQSIKVTISGDYSVTISNANGCTAISAIIKVTVNPLPSLPTQSIDCAGGVGNGKITIVSPIGTGLEYRLNTGPYQSNPVFSNIQNGSYFITVKNNNGCESSGNSFDVQCACTNPPTCLLNNESGNVCDLMPFSIGGEYGGTATEISVTTSGKGKLSSSKIITSPFNISYEPDVQDLDNEIEISFISNNPLGIPCKEVTKVFKLKVNKLPEVSISQNSLIPLCSGESRELVGNPPGGTFSIIGGGATLNGNNLTASNEGSVTINYSFTDNYGCTNSITQSLNIKPSPKADFFTYPPTPLCEIHSNSVAVTSLSFMSFIFDPPNGNLMIQNPNPDTIIYREIYSTTKLTLKIIDNNGCQDEIMKQIIIPKNGCNYRFEIDSFSKGFLNYCKIGEFKTRLVPNEPMNPSQKYKLHIELVNSDNNNVIYKKDTISNYVNGDNKPFDPLYYINDILGTGNYLYNVLFTNLDVNGNQLPGSCINEPYQFEVHVYPSPKILLDSSIINNINSSLIVLCKSNEADKFLLKDIGSDFNLGATYIWKQSTQADVTINSISISGESESIQNISLTKTNSAGCVAKKDFEVKFKEKPDISLIQLPCLPYVDIKGLKKEEVVNNLNIGTLNSPLIDISGVSQSPLNLYLEVNNGFCKDTATLDTAEVQDYANVEKTDLLPFVCGNDTSFIYPEPGKCYQWWQISDKGIVDSIGDISPKQQFILKKPGFKYFVRAYDCSIQNDCGTVTEPQPRSADEDLQIVNCDKEKALGVNLYPNPNFGDFTLELINAAKGFYEISITDILGKGYYKKNVEIGDLHAEIPVSIVARVGSIYFLHIKSPDGKMVTMKLIIIR